MSNRRKSNMSQLTNNNHEAGSPDNVSEHRGGTRTDREQNASALRRKKDMSTKRQHTDRKRISRERLNQRYAELAVPKD